MTKFLTGSDRAEVDRSHRIGIVGTGSYLPGEPVTIDQVENVLGRLTGVPAPLEARMDQFRERLLSRSGVERRYFAIDPHGRRQTETNASMLERASRQALEAARLDPDAIDLLICSSCAPDCLTPPLSVQLQERLGIARCTEIEIHSNCTGVPKGLQVALDMLRQGRYRTALVSYSQLSSIFLRREFYNPAKVTLEHVTLRWMLSDGSGALLLTRDPDGRYPELVEAYVESVGLGLAPGMTMALGAEYGPELANGPIPFVMALFEQGRHHLWQDVGRVANLAPEFAMQGLLRMLDSMGVSASDVTSFILPFPGKHFAAERHRELFRTILGGDDSRVPFMVSEFGYCGGAASLVQFDRMARSGRLRSGDLIAAYVEESSKWMSGGFLTRWA